MKHYDSIIIGAGHNGLIAASYLAGAGHKTLVLERNQVVGGACITQTLWDEYRVSAAAYLCSLLLPEVVQDLNMVRHGFEVYQREVPGFAPFADGSSFFVYSDEVQMRAELSKLCAGSPEDVDAFFQFEADIELAAKSIDPFLTSGAPTKEELEASFQNNGASHLMKSFLDGSVSDLLDARFRFPTRLFSRTTR